MVYPYVKNPTWQPGVAGGTVVTAAKLNNLEKQYDAAVDWATAQGFATKTQLDATTPVERLTVDSLPTNGIISAHRGGGANDAGDVPMGMENTISGIESAIRLGANIIDVDLQTTADGVLIAMHDTTVDRTTAGSGLVSNHLSSALPNVVTSRIAGAGYPDEPIPTLEEIFIRFGGRVILTVEVKEELFSLPAVAALIEKYKLQDSVFINTNTLSTVTAIVNRGLLAHYWATSGTTHVNPGIAAGAHLIEIPYNSSTTTIGNLQAAVADPTKNTRWFLASPINTRTQLATMSAGIMGYVSDAMGMLNRKTGDAPLVTSLTPSLKANKRGIGWFMTGALEISGGGLTDKTTDASVRGVYLGDFSGTMPGTYSLRYKFKAGAALPGTSGAVRMRVACTIPDKTGQDTDTDGYVVSLRGNGQVNLWASNGSFGAGVDIGSTTAVNPLVAGTEYSMKVDITPTTIKVTREDTGAVIGPVANTQWRGNHHYAIFSGTGTTLNSTMTAIERF